MLENLINLVRQYSGDAVINNPSIPNEKNEVAVDKAGGSIMDTLKNALSGGKINDVLNFFKNGAHSSPEIVKDATDNYANQLQQDMGLDPKEAQRIAGTVVPKTMGELAAKTADPGDNSFHIQDIFNNLSGGKTGGMNIQSMLDKFGGGKLDKDGDGDVDLQDLQAMFKGGSGGGSLLDSVKGLFN